MNYKAKAVFLLIFIFQVNLLCIENIVIYSIQREHEIYTSFFFNSFNFTKEDSWNCTWGNNYGVNGEAIAFDSSNNVYLAGERYALEEDINSIIFLVKYNQSGVLQWNYTWKRYEDYCIGLVIDAFDNIYITGNSYNYSMGRYDIFLIKLNTSGQEEWIHIWGGNSNDVVNAITTDTLGNIYLLGQTSSFGGDDDLLLAKYNSFGILQWNLLWSADVRGSEILIDSSNDIYIAGIYYIFNYEDLGLTSYEIFLLKYNSDRVMQWLKKWSVNVYERPMLIDSSLNLYIRGYTNNNRNVLAKYNSSGVLLWQHILNQTSGHYEDIALDSFGNIYITGTNHISRTDYEIFIRKFNSSGILLWEKAVKGLCSEILWCNAINLDSTDNIYITGTAYRSAFIIKNPQLGSLTPIKPFSYSYNIPLLDWILILIILVFSICGIIAFLYKFRIRKRENLE